MSHRSCAYLAKKLARPLPTKEGRTLRTVLDAPAYMVSLLRRRELRRQWQRACELLLAEADVGELDDEEDRSAPRPLRESHRYPLSELTDASMQIEEHAD